MRVSFLQTSSSSIYKVVPLLFTKSCNIASSLRIFFFCSCFFDTWLLHIKFSVINETSLRVSVSSNSSLSVSTSISGTFSNSGSSSKASTSVGPSDDTFAAIGSSTSIAWLSSELSARLSSVSRDAAVKYLNSDSDPPLSITACVFKEYLLDCASFCCFSKDALLLSSDLEWCSFACRCRFRFSPLLVLDLISTSSDRYFVQSMENLSTDNFLGKIH